MSGHYKFGYSIILITPAAGLGLRLVPYSDSKEKKAALELRGPYIYKGKMREKRKRNDVKDGGMSYELSRYVPLLKLAMEDQATDRMSSQYFPYIREPPQDKKKQSNLAALAGMVMTTNGGLLVATGNNPYSLRTLRSSWTNETRSKMKGDEDNFKENQKENITQESINLREYRKNGARVIVFVIGGIGCASRNITHTTRYGIFGDAILLRGDEGAQPRNCYRLHKYLEANDIP